MSAKQICHLLMRYYRIDELNLKQEKEFVIASKRRVVRFMSIWMTVAGEVFLNNTVAWTFVTDLMEALQKDNEKYNQVLMEEMSLIKSLMEAKKM
jgi:hypothetical protein